MHQTGIVTISVECLTGELILHFDWHNTNLYQRNPTGFEPGSSSFLRFKTSPKEQFDFLKTQNPLRERVL